MTNNGEEIVLKRNGSNSNALIQHEIQNPNLSSGLCIILKFQDLSQKNTPELRKSRHLPKHISKSWKNNIALCAIETKYIQKSKHKRK